ncbi:DUF1476 domain-containing protein [Roseospira marina]|uniref:DUF1476 domain-containing protein n=1 Tax=Roseospira marina TaxID=140057 RepID=A0A5M6I891_9PROT|nr:DUF1476 domain-containing protein [Roseospira marina]KAA5604456.1 DUF1476 domain-containing protein [Roseospira marina]MBB4315501.1 hypothetical protein [Roseospira marina]MBB5088562.1 hypothetical protein [Roseospira marina]
MSDPFRDREKGFEAKYEHDEALRFRILTRRNKLLGLWVAAEIGKTGRDADVYAQALIDYALVHGAPDALASRVYADLTNAGVEITRHRLEVRMSKLLHEAEAKINEERVAGSPSF